MARARGFTLSWARRRTDCWRSASSSESPNSTGDGYRTGRRCIFSVLTQNEPSLSRADVQARLKAERKDQKKAAKHRHRWRRRTLWSLATVVLLAGAGAGG